MAYFFPFLFSISCHPFEFYKCSPYNNPYDVQLCGYNGLLRIVGEIHENLYSGRNVSLGLNKASS